MISNAIATIALDGNTSNTIDVGLVDGQATQEVAVRLKSGTLVSNAQMGIKISNDGSNFYPLYDGSTLVTTGAALSATAFQTLTIPGVRYFQLWAQNGSGVNVNQTTTALEIEVIVTR